MELNEKSEKMFIKPVICDIKTMVSKITKKEMDDINTIADPTDDNYDADVIILMKGFILNKFKETMKNNIVKSYWGYIIAQGDITDQLLWKRNINLKLKEYGIQYKMYEYDIEKSEYEFLKAKIKNYHRYIYLGKIGFKFPGDVTCGSSEK